MLAEIFGVDGVVLVVVLVAVLFGSSQIPKLARSLGSAKAEFHKGQHEAGSAPTEQAAPAPLPPSQATPGYPTQAAPAAPTWVPRQDA
ncbi:twin-arginine translocase TatA/TatE family subunit [Aciditerrimonas ferrireducens]|jgi:TatA/E family protein of Tat protein translocase|uniref:Twin-arginine translocase TatA/TatE family subunit n=1 Tax=Aciditerrimonas ferrireducens TaxID=667306 RepID=A0ABV6BZK8_9ACTN